MPATETNPVTIRTMDAALWRALRAEAAIRGVPVADLLNTIIAEHLALSASILEAPTLPRTGR